MTKELKINDDVWFLDAYDNLIHATITKIIQTDKDNYLEVKRAASDHCYGKQVIEVKNVYTTKAECLSVTNKKNDEIIANYVESIQTMEDLIVFCFSKNVSLAEEYTDWNARKAAIKAAKKFYIKLE